MHSYRWCGSLPSTATTTTATTMIRRLCCLQSVSPSLPFSSAPTTIKKPLVLLGAPQVCLWELMLPSSFFTFFCFISFSAFQVSAIVLDMLLNASASPHSLFEVLIIYTRHFLVIPRSFHVYLHCVCNMQFIRLRPSWLSHLLEGTGARSSPSLPWPLMLLTEASPPISFSPPLKLETYLTFLSYSVYCVFFFLNLLLSHPIQFLQDDFLSNLKALQPHLCITAAYGNILPTKFLDIPPLGLSLPPLMPAMMVLNL